MKFCVHVEDGNNGTKRGLVTLTGALRQRHEEDLEAFIKMMLGQGVSSIAIEMNGVDEIEPLTLNHLYRCRTYAEEHGCSFSIIGPFQGPVQEFLNLTKATETLPIFMDRESAFAAIG